MKFEQLRLRDVLVILTHLIKGEIGRGAQLLHSSLQAIHIGIVVQYFRFVKEFALARVVVEIVVRDDFGLQAEVTNREGQCLLGSVHPGVHGVSALEITIFCDVRILDVAGGHQVARGQQQRSPDDEGI